MDKILTLDDIQIWILGLEPVMVLLVLNFLIGICLLSRTMRALREIVWLKQKLTALQLTLDGKSQPSKPKSTSEEFSQDQMLEKKPLVSSSALRSITETNNLEVEAFQAALEGGSSIEEASKMFNLTEDEAQVAAISYRSD
jgi:hypothetical protein